MARVLVIEDDESDVYVAKAVLGSRSFFQVEYAGTYLEGMAALAAHRPHIVLADLSIPEAPGQLAYADPMYGERLIEHCLRQARRPFVIVWSEHRDPAIEYLRTRGVDDYVVKSGEEDDDLRVVEDEMLGSIERSLGYWACKSEPARMLWDQLREIRQSAIVLTGPRGAGKGYLARLLHRLYRPRHAPIYELSLATSSRDDLAALAEAVATSACCPSTVLIERFDLATSLLEADQRLIAEIVGAVCAARPTSLRGHGPWVVEYSLSPILVLTCDVPWGDVATSPHILPKLRAAVEELPIYHVPGIKERVSDDLPELIEVFRREANRVCSARTVGFTKEAVETIGRWAADDQAGVSWDEVKHAVQEAVAKTTRGVIDLSALNLPRLPMRFRIIAHAAGEKRELRGNELDRARIIQSDEWDLILEGVWATRQSPGRILRAITSTGEVSFTSDAVQRVLYSLAIHAGEYVDFGREAGVLKLSPASHFSGYILEIRKALGDKPRGQKSRFIWTRRPYKYMIPPQVRLVVVLQGPANDND